MKSDELLQRMVQMGTLGYGMRRMANVLDIEDIEAFEAEFLNPDSEIAKAYQKGKDKSDYIIDLKIFELAKSGDLKAIEMYEQRKIDRGYELEIEQE